MDTVYAKGNAGARAFFASKATAPTGRGIADDKRRHRRHPARA